MCVTPHPGFSGGICARTPLLSPPANACMCLIAHPGFRGDICARTHAPPLHGRRRPSTNPISPFLHAVIQRSGGEASVPTSNPPPNSSKPVAWPGGRTKHPAPFVPTIAEPSKPSNTYPQKTTPHQNKRTQKQKHKDDSSAPSSAKPAQAQQTPGSSGPGRATSAVRPRRPPVYAVSTIVPSVRRSHKSESGGLSFVDRGTWERKSRQQARAGARLHQFRRAT